MSSANLNNTAFRHPSPSIARPAAIACQKGRGILSRQHNSRAIHDHARYTDVLLKLRQYWMSTYC